MNKIFNWTFGSIFRTLGRVIAYVIIGIIVVLLFNFNAIKKPKISNILNDIFFMRVNASELVHSVDWAGRVSAPFSTNDLTTDSNKLFYWKHIFSINNRDNPYLFSFHFNTSINTSTFDFIEWDYFVSEQVLESDSFRVSALCDRYTGDIGGNDYYECTRYIYFNNRVVPPNFDSNNFSVWLSTTRSDYGVSCTISDNKITCPTDGNFEITGINLFVNYIGKDNLSDDFYIYFSGYPTAYVKSDNGSTQIITNQNQNTQDIINNQNQNNQSVINNQNANTNATIENQNQNTQQQIDSQQVCNFIDKNNIVKDGYIDSNGAIHEETWDIENYGLTDYINILKSTITPLNIQNNAAASYCFYNINKTKISCYANSTMTANVLIIIPNNASYVRFSINKKSNLPQINICQSGNQAMANTITDSNVSEANSSAGGFFNNFSTTDNGGLSSIITAPLSAIQSLTSATCSPLVLPLPFVNENLTLPCMRTIYESNFGGFMTLYDLITIGIISYWILVRIFNLVKDFKNPDHDEIEVVDL